MVQPRFGEGPLEDARPPRLANAIGTAFLGCAALLWWLGAPAVGTALASLVAFLALLAAATGLCAGCEILQAGRGCAASPRSITTASTPTTFRGWTAPRCAVEFTHPLCAECRDWERRLSALDDPLFTVDVRSRPDLARKYGVAMVPTVVAVGPDGAVLERLAP